jgi:hypothetical protein
MAYTLAGNTSKAREAWTNVLRLEPTNRFALDHLNRLRGKP